MPSTALDRMKTELCARIEEMIASLTSAEDSVKQGNFDASAEILDTVSEQIRAAALAARTSEAESSQTPWIHFKRPILEVLVREGGSALNWQVFQYLEDHLRLTEGDKEQHVDETRETEWQHECRVAGKVMREEPLNYLEPVTVPGVWTITEAGRAHLDELRRADGQAFQ